MKKILYNICIMIIIIICPINVWASDDLIVINDQEKINIEYVEISNDPELFSREHKISMSVNPNTEKRVGSYKLKANQYVTLKISYSSTNKIRVGIVSKSRKYVALKNIKSNDIQRIKVGETDTYWIFMQNNSNKKITVNGVYIC